MAKIKLGPGPCEKGWMGKATKRSKRAIDDSLDVQFGVKPKRAKYKRSVWKINP